MALEHVPGTRPLEAAGDLAQAMVDGMSAFLDGELRRAGGQPMGAEGGPELRRLELARRIGVVDRREHVAALQLDATTERPSLLARTPAFEVHAVRWPVLPGVEGEGLLLHPAGGAARAHVVVLPDADLSPEALAGLAPGLSVEAQVARRMAASGCRVVVPTLIDREGTWADGRPHREHVWRMAFEAGRHIIGYEVQKVLALVDWCVGKAPVGVFGYGEGGLVALHAGALDTRIAAVAVSGHFGPPTGLWRQPVYRDVWGLLRHGWTDAGLAAMVAPRGLVVEAVAGPVVVGPEPGLRGEPRETPGSLGPVAVEAVREEVERAREAFAACGARERLVWLGPGPGGESGGPGSAGGCAALLQLMGVSPETHQQEPLEVVGAAPDPAARMHRQFRQLCDFTQRVLRESQAARDVAWAGADRSSPEAWRASTEPFRRSLRDEVLGRLPEPTAPSNPRTRLRYDRPLWKGYEAVLDLWPGVFAQGILLVPRDLRPGERRPVVVCQHGLEGRAADVVEGPPDSGYADFAARLAERGYVTYAPQNPYIGHDAFRTLQRKARPLQLTLFSFIVAQHQRALEWLGGLPFVDPSRIGFYGLSYGGVTAMRVPAVLPGYCLSICSANFNEWVLKCASEDIESSYLYTSQYEMYEWDLAHTCNYAEMAALIAPRPFMVERGHDDPVATDEWVAMEYARVKRLYDQLGVGDRTAIEYFAGGHSIHAEETFRFIERHLGNPRGA